MTEAAIHHTPGPWEIVPTVHSDRKHIFHLDPMNAYYIGTLISGSRKDLALFKANVRLMGTAPELLDALEDILGDRPDIQGGICRRCGRDYRGEIHTGNCPSDDCPAYIARAAIAKARGQA